MPVDSHIKMTAIEEVSTVRVRIDGAMKGSFADFYSTNFAQLTGSLVLYTGDSELAMDLAQETMARAYRDWRKVCRLDSPPAWLHRVAFNLANSTFRKRMNEWRSSARWRARSETVHHDADTPDAVTIRRLVASLPSRQKTALVLRYYADLSVKETADVMGCAEGTVRALTSQALESLRRSDLSLEPEGERL
jgi:RNA polymerase sigma-70 factor (ECF subfamily)